MKDDLNVPAMFDLEGLGPLPEAEVMALQKDLHKMFSKHKLTLQHGTHFLIHVLIQTRMHTEGPPCTMKEAASEVGAYIRMVAEGIEDTNN